MTSHQIAPLCAALWLVAPALAIAEPAPAAPPVPAVTPAPAAPTPDTSAADREAIRARLREWVGGMVTRDPAAMDKVLSSDFQTITYGGRLIDRSGDIAAVTASPDFEVKAVTTKEIDIRLYGDAAVVRALVSVIERRDGRIATVPMRITQTWIRQVGEWRAVADQATQVEAAPPATPVAPAASPMAVGAAPPNG